MKNMSAVDLTVLVISGSLDEFEAELVDIERIKSILKHGIIDAVLRYGIRSVVWLKTNEEAMEYILGICKDFEKNTIDKHPFFIASVGSHHFNIMNTTRHIYTRSGRIVNTRVHIAFVAPPGWMFIDCIFFKVFTYPQDIFHSLFICFQPYNRSYPVSKNGINYTVLEDRFYSLYINKFGFKFI